MKPRILFALLAAGAVLLAPAASRAQLAEKKVLTLEAAKMVASTAAAEARARNAGGAVAVVDDGGNLLYLERLDGTFPAAATVSFGKARTAALFRKPTGFFEDVINKGRTTMVALADFTPLQGGVPIVVGDQVVGAVGVSGAASAAQDEEIAQLAARVGAALTLGPSGSGGLTFLDAKTVADAFAQGKPLVEVNGYKVHASRRDRAGQAEVHVQDTDIVYVLDGAATFVTGGKVLEGTAIAPGEIRGTGIEGGETRQLEKGDVVIVPRGMPHWFKSVKGPFLYYVVKVA